MGVVGSTHVIATANMATSNEKRQRYKQYFLFKGIQFTEGYLFAMVGIRAAVARFLRDPKYLGALEARAEMPATKT